ncbi:MAG: YciI family protein [Hyphomicrobiaceae bacterium]
MPKFVYVYHGGGKPDADTDMAKVMAAWNSWLDGVNAVDRGAPVGMSSTVHPGGSVSDDGGANPTSGYSIVEASNKDDAVARAKGCPILDSGGSVEVCEIMQM